MTTDWTEETVRGWLSDDPENALCIVCGDPVDLSLSDPNRLMCPGCSRRADEEN